MGIEFDPGDVERLGQYLALLLETNKTHNLTAVRDPDEAWTRHVLDSLSLLPLIASAAARTVIDVGSGGGLPGLPLAIVMPDVHFTLLEATGKKARFLAQTADRLHVANVAVVNDRAETVGQDASHHRERYDLATARAVGRLPVLLELTLPLVGVGGHVLAIKGRQARREIEEAGPALRLLHGRIVDRVSTSTGTILVVRKTSRTPPEYPRRPGEPKRAPLGGSA